MNQDSKQTELREQLTLGERASALRVQEALFGSHGEVVTFDRYEVIEVVGRGAFGTVYRCRDPKLGRDVALKIFMSGDETLIREAKTMATISHPNIAAIYDAGVAGEGAEARVYIAMELVVGMTLRQWQSTPRTMTQCLAMLVQAGQGLAAAHAAGVVHLDFKPDNVLVGVDGRVRVVDFGLSIGAEDAQPTVGQAPIEECTTNMKAGTPAYMSAEQHAGQVGTILSDQFSFCVTAWETLYDQRPFAGANLAELATAVSHATPQVASTEKGPPSAVKEALLRGLLAAPKDRHAGMDALLLHLRPKQPRRRSRSLALGALLLFLGGGGAALLLRPEANAALCEPDATGLAKVWNSRLAAKLAAKFVASGRPSAEQSWQRSEVLLAQYGTDWELAKVHACEATHWRKEQSVETLERRMLCYDRHFSEYSALLDVFAMADASTVDRAIAASLSLPPLKDCTDPSYLQARAKPVDPKAKAAVDTLYEKLARAIALHKTGQGRRALALAQAVAKEAATLEYGPLGAAAAIWIAESALQLGQIDQAVQAGRQAFDLALQSGDDRNAVHATTILAFQGAYDPSKKAAGLKWVETGRSLLGRIGNDRAYAAKLANAEGNNYLTANEAALARPAFQRTIDAFIAMDPKHPNIASSMGMIGISYLQEGALGEARSYLSEALERVAESLGPKHPEAASLLVNLSLVETALGNYAHAETLLRRGAEIQISVFGESYALLVYTRLNLGITLMRQGEYLEAAEQIAAAQELCAKTYGASHPLMAQILAEHSEAMAYQGKGARAIALAQRSLALLAASFGEKAPDLGRAFAALSLAHRQAGDVIKAIQSGRQGVEATAGFGPADPRVLLLSFELAESLRVGAQREEARSLYQELLKRLVGPNVDPRALSRIQFGLAQVLVGAKAATLARVALAGYPKDGDPREREEMTRWITNHFGSSTAGKGIRQ